jgi:hypothetical protein
MPKSVIWLLNEIKEFYRVKFFGEVVVKFNNGIPVHMAQTVSRKPPQEGNQ